MKKNLKLLIKVTFVVALLYFLIQRGFISLQDTGKAFTRWELMGPAFAVLFFNLLLGALRWQWLLKAQGIRLPILRTLQLTFIGNFFNIALPGAVSGDFVKAFYIGREVHGQRGRAFGAILFDRVAGLSALVLLSAGAVLFGQHKLSHSVIIAIRTFLAIAATCVLAFYGYLFLMREKHDPVLRILKNLEARFAKAGSLVRIYEGVRHYHHHRKVVFKVLLLSILIHSMIGWVFLQFAQAVGEERLFLLPLYVVVPLGLLVTAVPIAPAGVGTGHAAFLYFFQLLGSPRGADVFTLYAISGLIFGAFGGLVYLRFRTHELKDMHLA